MERFDNFRLMAEAGDDGGGDLPFKGKAQDAPGSEDLPFKGGNHEPDPLPFRKVDDPLAGLRNPDKYRGKSVAEIARMHEEAESLIGRQGQEFKERVDALIEQLAARPDDGGDDPGEGDPEPPRKRREGGGRKASGRRPDPEEDPDGYEDWLADRAAERLEARRAARESQDAWDAYAKGNGLGAQEIAAIREFWSNPKNLTPAFLHAAMDLDKAVDAGRRSAAEGMRTALGRVAAETGTTVAARRSDGASVPKDPRAAIRAMVDRGDMAGARRLVKELYEQHRRS